MRQLVFLCFLFSPIILFAKQQKIEDFVIKENLSQNGKLAIILVDSTEKVDNSIRGNFRFVINGFQQDLQFQDGVAVYNHVMESSTFVLIKHKNQDKEIGRYYYIRKTDQGLKPYKISVMALLLIPTAFLLVAYLFKRFLIMIVLLVVAYGYFHYSNGLSISQLMETFFLGLKNLL